MNCYEKYNEIQEKVENNIKKKKIDSEPVYNEKYARIKKRSYKGKTNNISLKKQHKVLIVFVYQLN